MAVAFLWTALLGLQLLRSIRIDAYELSHSRIDLLGYWVSFLISLLLGLWLLNRSRMMLTPLFLMMTLLNYIAFVITLTAPSQEIISFLISRHGVVMWFVLGIGFSAVIEILTIAKRRGRLGNAKKAVVFLLGVLGLLALNFAREIVAEPVQTLSYQAVASSATILLLIGSGVLVALWGKKIPVSISLAYIGIGTALVTAVALTQSTSIVASWLGILAVFFVQTLRESRLADKFALLVILLLGAVYFMNSEAYERFTTITRFVVFFESDGDFTSLTTRIALLSSFVDQFAVSPVFGHFQAELVAGVGNGFYIHSVPLSFLTHTGLIGTTFFFSAFYLLIRKRTFLRSGLVFSETHMGRMMWVVLGVGTISTFLSWPVIWFMMGALCKRPMSNR